MKFDRLWILISFIGFLYGSNSASSAEFLLYDASSGTLPGTQPWLFYAALGSATQTSLGTSGTRLTTDQAAQAGWSNTIPILNSFKNPAFPALISSDGFAIDWSMQMLSESHSSQNRAGTSIILLGSDNRGIELGFWTDQIWAQTSDPLFTKGESTNFDTTSNSVDYRLLIFGDTYSLYADNVSILTGQTRSYAAFGSAPYTLSNYYFLGDNTTSAGASVDIGSIRLITSVPETGWTGLIVAIVAIFAIVAKRRLAPVRSIA
jgi:hypothetical protein